MKIQYSISLENDNVDRALTKKLCGKDEHLGSVTFSALYELDQNKHYRVHNPYILQIKKCAGNSHTTLVNLELRYNDLVAFLQCIHNIFRKEKHKR